MFANSCSGAIASRDLKTLVRDFPYELGLLVWTTQQAYTRFAQIYPPKVAVSSLVNFLKGVSSRMLRQERPDLRKRYWKGALQSPSYFAASCGRAPISILKEYIDQQKTPSYLSTVLSLFLSTAVLYLGPRIGLQRLGRWSGIALIGAYLLAISVGAPIGALAGFLFTKKLLPHRYLLQSDRR